MFRITYSSVTTETLCDADLGNMLLDSREEYSRLEVTGALLYRDGRFLQVLEGPKNAVEAVYARITADTRQIVQVFATQTILVRRFPTWTMGYERSGGTFKLHLADYDHPYERLPRSPAAECEAAVSHETFDSLYATWFASPVLQTSGQTHPHTGRPHAMSAVTTLRGKEINVGTSDAVNEIFDNIIDDIHSGLLRPGDRLNDMTLARRFGTSRTPVREAIQKLREIGVVKVAANRFTRIAVVDQSEAAQQVAVWKALYLLVLDEVIGDLAAEVIEGLRTDRRAFERAVALGEIAPVAGISFDFFMRLVGESANSALQKTIYPLAQVLKLGAVHFEALVGLNSIIKTMDDLIESAISGDTAKARQAVTSLTRPAEVRQGNH